MSLNEAWVSHVQLSSAMSGPDLPNIPELCGTFQSVLRIREDSTNGRQAFDETILSAFGHDRELRISLSTLGVLCLDCYPETSSQPLELAH